MILIGGVHSSELLKKSIGNAMQERKKRKEKESKPPWPVFSYRIVQFVIA